MTRMDDAQEHARLKVENAQAEMAAMKVELQLARMRVEQARVRYPVTGWLLGPVSAYLESWDARIGRTLDALAQVWTSGNHCGWRK